MPHAGLNWFGRTGSEKQETQVTPAWNNGEMAPGEMVGGVQAPRPTLR